MTVSFHYAAFASYAVRPDIQLVRDVENFLESLDQNHLIEQRFRRKINICRDGSDFTLPNKNQHTSDGKEVALDIINNYLRICKNFIVFVGPSTRDHRWIVDELDLWLAEPRSGRVLICLTHGDHRQVPERLFPRRVLDDRLHEPFYFDLRGFTRKARRTLSPRPYEEERVRLAAALMEPEVAASELVEGWKIAAARARRVQNRLRFCGIAVMLGLAAFGVYATRSAFLNYRNARAGEFLANARGQSAPNDAIQFALRAYSEASDPVGTMALGAVGVIQEALVRSLRYAWSHPGPLDPGAWDIPPPRRPRRSISFDDSGDTLFVHQQGRHPARFMVTNGEQVPVGIDGALAMAAAVQPRTTAVSPDKRFVAVLSRGELQTFDARSGALVQQQAAPGAPENLDIAGLSNDGTTFAGLDDSGKLWVFRPGAPPSQSCQLLPEGASDIGRLAVAPNSGLVALDYRRACGENRFCRITTVVYINSCQRVTSDRVFSEGDFRDFVLSDAENAKDVRLAIGLRTGFQLASLDSSVPDRLVVSGRDVELAAFTLENKILATAGSQGDIILYDTSNLEQAAVVPGFLWNEAIALSPDGSTLSAAGYTDHGIRLDVWQIDYASKAARARYAALDSGGPIAWHPARPLIAAGGAENVALVDADTAKISGVLDQPPECSLNHSSLRALAFSRDRLSLIGLYWSGIPIQWALDSKQGRCLTKLPTGAPLDFLSDDGERVLGKGVQDTRIIGWDQAHGQSLACLDEKVVPRSVVTANSSGRFVAWYNGAESGETPGHEIKINIKDLNDCVTDQVSIISPELPQSSTRSLRALALDSRGEHFAALIEYGATSVVIIGSRVKGWVNWHSTTLSGIIERWKQMAVITKAAQYDELAFSPGGTEIAVRGTTSVDVMRVDDGTQLFSFDLGNAYRPGSLERSLVFSPDGNYLAVSVPEEAPIIRPISTTRIISEACDRLLPEQRPADPCSVAPPP